MAGTAPIPAEQLRAVLEPVLPWLAGEAEQPPRAVVGAAVKTTARWLAQQVPGAKLLILPGVSHFAPWQDPARFNAAVLEFLSGG